MAAGATHDGLQGLPERHGGTIVRQRLSDLLEHTIRSHFLVSVMAPSGYGKTVAVRDWAASVGHPVAWVSLRGSDNDPYRLGSSIVRGIQRVLKRDDEPTALALRAIDPEPSDLAAFSRAVLLAVQELDQPLTLVVDDAQRGGEALAHSVLGALVEEEVAALRIVLVHSEPIPLDSPRLLVSGSASEIGAEDLAFRPDEIAALAGLASMRLTTLESEQVHASTTGWPAALRLLILGAHGDKARMLSGLEGRSGDQVVEFVRSAILARLPERLAEFIRAATTTDDTDAPLAHVLSDMTDAAALLDECTDRGLFLDRFHTLAVRPSYRWHPVFAAAVRADLRRTEPLQAHALHLRAALHLAESDPLRAFREALHAEAGQVARTILVDNWLDLLVGRNSVRGLDRACAELPAPWRDDPEITMIRACCRDVAGQRREGQRMLTSIPRPPKPSDESSDSGGLTHALATLFLADDRDALSEAVEDTYLRMAKPKHLPAGSDWQYC